MISTIFTKKKIKIPYSKMQNFDQKQMRFYRREIREFCAQRWVFGMADRLV